MLHALPYLLLLSVAGRWLLFGVLGLETMEQCSDGGAALLWHGGKIGWGIAFGIAKGITSGITFGIARRIALGVVFGIAFGIATGITLGITTVIAIPRVYYWLPHPLFLWPKLKSHWYPRHPVAWDDLCGMPFPGLDRLLAGYAEIAPAEGRREIARLIDHYPAQRQAGLRAQCRLIAREAARETNLARLDTGVAALPEGDKGFLAYTPRLKQAVGDIARLQQRLDALNRPFLREPSAALLCEKIKTLQGQIAGYPPPLAEEFRPAAARWLDVAERQHRQVQTVLQREPSPQVFRAGDPVDRRREAFVPRESVLEELDRQLTLSTGCPGVILYARRRMGKSSLLRNLDGFLPTSTRVAVLSMQNPQVFTSQEYFFQQAGEALRQACPQLLDFPEAADLPGFFAWLGKCDAELSRENLRLLLAIDEYENLDEKIGQGVFSLDPLAAVRESIQYHRRLIWLFAGSHAIDELRHAPWPSYLISARTVEIPPFSAAETRLLLTEPLRHSPLWDKNDPKRPRFAADFWGEGGIERMQQESAGWPHLLQLLAETAVDLSNDREQPALPPALLEQAIAKAVTVGDTVLRQLLRGEADEAEWAYLQGFRRQDTQAPPPDEAVHQALRRRQLVSETADGQWRLRVPLMQRWLRERG